MKVIQVQGVIPASLTPFTSDLEVDDVALRTHLEWLVNVEGIGGVMVNGHAGEVDALSRGERCHVIEIAAGKAEGRVPLLAGLYAESHRDGVLLAKEAVAAGADALVVFPTPHFAFEVSPEVPYRHFAEVADAVSVPLVVFCYPTWTGMAYTEELLTRICGIPSVAAIKDWTLDIRSYERNMRAVKALRPDIAILSSFSTNLLPSLAVGADGILSGHGSVIADLQVALFEAVRVNDLAVAKGVYERIQILTQVVYRFPMSDMYTRMKQQLVMLGRLTNAHVRPPLLAIADDELSELRSSLTAAGLQ